jgi:protein ImuB
VRREPTAPRVVALLLPDLPVQRLRRAREGEAPPLAIVEEGRVIACDPSARAAGVRLGMTAVEALAACGRAEVVPVDRVADRAALRALAEVLLGLAPAVEVSPPDVLMLDASAAPLLVRSRALAEGEAVLAERAIAAAAEMGYAARAAVVTGRGPARAIVRHASTEGGGPAVIHVAPADTARVLARLPAEAVGLPAAIATRLAAVGIRDAGALARLPPGVLAHRFGAEGAAAARLARGDDPSPLVPHVPETLPEEGLELEAPAESAEPLLFALKRLADRVAVRLAGRGLGATRLRLVLRLDPRGEERIAIPLAQPTAVASRWLVPLKEHLFSLRLPGAVTALRLFAEEVAPARTEQLAFGDRPEALAALETVLARLAVRLGDGALFAAEPVERYRPEGAYRPVPFRPGSARRSGPTPREVGGVASRREPDQSAVPVAREPEAPAWGAHRPTRLLAAPEPVVAEGEGGRLTAIRVGGRDRAVLAFEGPERLRGEWWSGLFDRDYYRVRLDGLGECWLYRDGADGRLWLHGFFD